MSFRTRAAALAACAAVLAGCGDDRPIDPAVRAAGFTFDASVAPGDREWILAAIENARPEAQQLIADVDGMVTIKVFADPHIPIVGLTQTDGGGTYHVSFNIAKLNGDRKIDRDVTVLHELGHVIDHRLVPPELREELTGSLPKSGACYWHGTGDCAAPQERFADTFAKWALRGAVSATGAGYSVLTPASLEDWGAPLALLAIKIDVASR
jgi:hypothetical protein